MQTASLGAPGRCADWGCGPLPEATQLLGAEASSALLVFQKPLKLSLAQRSPRAGYMAVARPMLRGPELGYSSAVTG